MTKEGVGLPPDFRPPSRSNEEATPKPHRRSTLAASRRCGGQKTARISYADTGRTLIPFGWCAATPNTTPLGNAGVQPCEVKFMCIVSEAHLTRKLLLDLRIVLNLKHWQTLAPDYDKYASHPLCIKDLAPPHRAATSCCASRSGHLSRDRTNAVRPWPCSKDPTDRNTYAASETTRFRPSRFAA
jgi:hypothetical protein